MKAIVGSSHNHRFMVDNFQVSGTPIPEPTNVLLFASLGMVLMFKSSRSTW